MRHDVRALKVTLSDGERVEPLGGPASDLVAPAFLDQVDERVRSVLLSQGRRLALSPGATLINEGDLGGRVYLILRGWAKSTEMAAGLSRMTDLYGPGDLVGQSAMLTGQPYAESVVAIDRVDAVVIPDDSFLEALIRWPQAFKAVAAAAEFRLARARRRQVGFSALPVHSRLAAVLLELSQRAGRSTGDGLAIQVRLSQTDLASLCGASGDTVQRSLRQLRSTGVLRTGYRRIVIADVEMLATLANPNNPSNSGI